MSAPTTPAAVPELADMPSTVDVPVCEWSRHTPGPGCDAAATVRIRVHGGRPCGNFSNLLCDEHLEKYRQYLERRLSSFPGCLVVCSGCRKPLRHLSDVLLAVIKL